MKIDQLSQLSGSPLGGEEVWIRCSTTKEELARVVFSSDEWSTDAVIEHQSSGLIIVKTPAKPTDNELNTVNVQLVQGDQVSKVVKFSYICEDRPTELCPLENVKWMKTDGQLVKLQELCQSSNKHASSAAKLWATHLTALWQYCAEGDAQPFINICSPLIGHQDTLEGNTALHICCRNGQSSALIGLFAALDAESRDRIVNLGNYKSQTALHLAVKYGDSACVHYLLANGARRDRIDNEGNTVAHLLADTFNEDIYKDVLFPPGDRTDALDLGVINRNGYSCVHIAVHRFKTQLVELLIEAGADLSVTDATTGENALHKAVLSHDTPMTKIVLKNSPSLVTIANHAGHTALHLAIAHVHEPIVMELVKVPESGEILPAMADYVRQTILDEDGANRMLAILKSEKVEEPLRAPPLHAVYCNRPLNRVAVKPNNHLLGQLTDPHVPDPDQPCSSRSLTDEMTRTQQARAFNDDVSGLSFITRVRLSAVLDSQWTTVAMHLGCEHMVELLTVCAQADENASPTALLLDQYEQMPGSCIASLRGALDRMQCTEAVRIVDDNGVVGPGHGGHEEVEDEKSTDDKVVEETDENKEVPLVTKSDDGDAGDVSDAASPSASSSGASSQVPVGNEKHSDSCKVYLRLDLRGQ